jgi:hypothetical protein
MSKFIKLSNVILNIKDIHKIVIKQDKYYIHTVSKKLDGFSWNIGLFGIGKISSHTSEIEVCKDKNLNDYITISHWISKN